MVSCHASYVIWSTILSGHTCNCCLSWSDPTVLTHNSSLVNLILWDKFVFERACFVGICSRSWVVLHTNSIWLVSVNFWIKRNKLPFTHFWFRIICVVTVHGWINTFWITTCHANWIGVPISASLNSLVFIWSWPNRVLVLIIVNPISWVSCF